MEPFTARGVTHYVDDVRVWASHLAGEGRGEAWVRNWYVIPDALVRIARELDTVRSSGLIGLIGSQGVGKSSALLALYSNVTGGMFSDSDSIILFKWRREQDLFASLLNGTHEVSSAYLPKYYTRLVDELRPNLPSLEVEGLEKFGRLQELASRNMISSNRSDVIWAESTLDKAVSQRLREDAWHDTLLGKSVILIDTPDYSKTDRRRMAKDLDAIYWFWNAIANQGAGPTIVVAIQKEMSQGHFFLDKMQKFELEPLAAEKMLEAYGRRFGSTHPFTEGALLKLAQMSRGIFRRFLRYIIFTLDLWETKAQPRRPVDEELVRRAVPVQRLVEDMDLELSALFPKHSDLRLLAVRLLMLLEQSAERKQSELADLLEVEPYVLSRLLTKLEAACYVTRRRDGNDKIVSLWNVRNRSQTTQVTTV